MGGAFSFIKKDNLMGKRLFIICFVIYPPFLNYLLRTVFSINGMVTVLIFPR